jgi:hypothetical protein
MNHDCNEHQAGFSKKKKKKKKNFFFLKGVYTLKVFERLRRCGAHRAGRRSARARRDLPFGGWPMQAQGSSRKLMEGPSSSVVIEPSWSEHLK